MRHGTSVAIYGLSIGLSAIVTLSVIPVVIDHAGPRAWASLAVGQAVGTGAAILTGFGWGTTGPTDVARADASGRPQIYVESLRARALLYAPLLAVAVLVTFAVVDQDRVAAALNAGAFASTGLLAGWFFSGAARPVSFLLFDACPRVVGNVVGAAALSFGLPLEAFPAAILIGVLLGVVATSRAAAPGVSVLRSADLHESIQRLRAQTAGLSISVVAAAYASIPLVIVSTVAPAALSFYALADKLLRFATTAYAPLIQFMQGWVPAGELASTTRKVRIAWPAGAVLALLGGVCFVLLAPWLADLLSHGQVQIGDAVLVPFALALTAMVLAQVTGLVCLLALGEAQMLARVSLMSAVLGLPGIFIGAVVAGVSGAAWMLAAAECLSMLLQVGLLVRAMRKRPEIPSRTELS